MVIIWKYMGIYGNIWESMKIYGTIYGNMSEYLGFFFFKMDMFGKSIDKDGTCLGNLWKKIENMWESTVKRSTIFGGSMENIWKYLGICVNRIE